LLCCSRSKRGYIPSYAPLPFELRTPCNTRSYYEIFRLYGFSLFFGLIVILEIFISHMLVLPFRFLNRSSIYFSMCFVFFRQ